MDEGVADGDGAVEFLAKIVRSVILAVELESGGDIVHGGHGCYDRLHCLGGIVKCRGVNEGLENRAGLAARQGVIGLAFPGVASGDEGANFTGARVERDERYLWLRNRLAHFFP